MKSLFSRFRHKDKETVSPPVPPPKSDAGSSRRPSVETINNNNIPSRPTSALRRRSTNQTPTATSTPTSPILSRPGSPSTLSPGTYLQRPTIPHRTSSSGQPSRPSSILGLEGTKGQYEPVEDVEDMRARTLSATYLEVMGQGGGKKVTFRSPVPTPPSSALMEDHLASYPLQPDTTATSTTPTTSLGDRFRSATMRKHSLPPLSSVRPIHPSMSSSRASSSSSPSKSPHHTLPSSSLASPAPSGSGSMASETSYAGSTQSYIAQPNSWSEMAEDDLIANLGPVERTRQEVLWEIVSSEERYVQELIKLTETFCRTLLPPPAQSPTLTLHDPFISLSRTLSPSSMTSPSSPASHESPNLPIAARYSRSTSSIHSHDQPTDSENPRHTTSPPEYSGVAARLDAYNKLTNGRPTGLGLRSKPSTSSMRDRAKAQAHQSLPPQQPSRGVPESRSGSSSKGWSGSFARLSHPTHRSGSGSTRIGSGSSLASISQGHVAKDVVLPDELGQVLAVLSGGILEGHLKLAAALRRRYEDQYPLVRSLADVFTAHSYILREYATYILHLEAALGTIDSALQLATHPPNSRHSRQLEASTAAELLLGRTLLSLEELATERGESGLAISLSKPFQRLLKYPLLFQNLLFNTDPSLREYEATLAMVDEVESIVRGIEDEKVGKEERERTRDIWARIEGLEIDKGLMAPKSDRLLLDETRLSPAGSAIEEAENKGKKSKQKHRLSDMLKKTEKAELWIVRFSDVSLLCEKAGATQLPISSTTSKRESMPELSDKRRSATMGRRHQSIRARNLYRFVRVYQWDLQPNSGSTDPMLSMDEISRVRTCVHPAPDRRHCTLPSSQSTPSTPPKRSHSPDRTPHARPPSQAPSRVPLKSEDGPSSARTVRSSSSRPSDGDTILSDRLSVMSFAFNGEDQVRPTRLRPKSTSANPTIASGARAASSSSRPSRVNGAHLHSKAADAKFAHRLRATEAPPTMSTPSSSSGGSTLRPTSAARRSLPPAMMRSGLNGACSGEVRRPLALNPQALDRVHHTSPAPLFPKNGVNGLNAKVASRSGSGAKERDRESISSRKTQPRGKTVGPVKDGVVARTAKTGRGGMI